MGKIQLINNENFMIRTEYKVLLYCARKDENLEIKDIILSLIQDDFDWEYLLEIAFEHRLANLLYYHLNSLCPENVPEDVLMRLRNDFNRNIQNNLLLSSELVKIMDIFKSNKITAVPYKGPVLASLAYGTIALRQSGDLDILIDESDIKKAKDILVLEGYELNSPIKINDPSYMKLESEYQFINRKNSIRVEINWKPEGNFFSIPSGIFFNDLEKTYINNFKLNTLSPVNQLLILCIHCAKHDWSRLFWICDISEFIKSSEINWYEVLKRAEDIYIKRILLVTLVLAKDLFELDLPDFVLSRIERDPYVRKISNEAKKRLFIKNKSLNLFQKFLLDIRKREKLLYGIRDCISGLTKPTYVDYEDFSLPESLFSLYYLLRPFLLLKRYGKDSIEI